MVRPSVPSFLKPAIPWLLFLAAIWAQLFYAASYGWTYGQYYDYGWYVPALAALFFLRRFIHWREMRNPIPAHIVSVGMLLALAAWLTGLRIIEKVDPTWTLPLWAQAITVSAVTLLVVYRAGGRSAALGMAPVIIFALTAIQLPTIIERLMVSALTQGVVGASVSLLGLFGQQVVAVGSQLEVNGQIVQVAEGCSGIKSAQSFLMVSLFFGEWMQLPWKQRWIMVASGLFTAWFLNIVRACLLAFIRANEGADAFTKAHDPLGILTFIAGALILLGVSSYLGGSAMKRMKTRKLVKRSVA